MPARNKISQIRILLVEDQEQQRCLFEKWLTYLGFSVTLAPDAKKALSLCRAAAPDVILSDWCLDGVSGLYFLQALRSRESTKDIPFIMMSGLKENPADEARVRDEGGDLFMTKSEMFDSEQLRQAFARRVQALALGRRRPAPGIALAVARPNAFQKAGELMLDGKKAFLNYVNIGLTAREFDLLALLMKNRPRTVTWRDIQREVWCLSGDELSNKQTPSIQVILSRLRNKLGEASSCIRVQRGAGLRFLAS